MIPGLARLSASSLPVITSDTTTTSLYYTDGFTTFTLDVSHLAVGQYDVDFDGANLNTEVLGSPRGPEWVGSINIAVPGQLTCHVSLGQTRQWDIYNAFNQKTIALQITKMPAPGTVFEYTPPYDFPTIHLYNDDPSIKATVFTGAPETVQVRYSQSFWIQTEWVSGGDTPALCQNQILWNPSTNFKNMFPSGIVSAGNVDDFSHATGRTLHSFLTVPATQGVNSVYPGIQARGPGIVLLYGGDLRQATYPYLGTPDHFMNLTASWMG